MKKKRVAYLRLTACGLCNHRYVYPVSSKIECHHPKRRKRGLQEGVPVKWSTIHRTCPLKTTVELVGADE